MTDRAGQIDGPAKWAAVAVLGGVGILGVGRSLFVESVHSPLDVAPPQQVRIDPVAAVPSTEAAADDGIDATSAMSPAESQANDALPNNRAPLSATDDVSIRIAVNSASAAELDLLPGIGPIYAQRIVDERAANGLFTSIEDLQRVRGIGPKTAAKLAPLITFDSP
ncbi:MAG: helix-hairpin-helix domain-containing protein [Planctomycetota bacterium]